MSLKIICHKGASNAHFSVAKVQSDLSFSFRIYPQEFATRCTFNILTNCTILKIGKVQFPAAGLRSCDAIQQPGTNYECRGDHKHSGDE